MKTTLQKSSSSSSLSSSQNPNFLNPPFSLTMNHQQQQPPSALPASRSSFSGGDCGNCGAHLKGLLLHNVRLRGIQRRLCTTCVLRLHPSQFCPVCFAFYDSNPPHPSKRFSCSNCSSFTHSHCLSSPPPPPPYLCPPCSAPSPASFSFFPNSTAADGGAAGGRRRIDSKSAAVLLCAARIASASMAKAVAVARMDAEKKAKEAAVARKKAREALERVGMLMNLKNNVNVAQNNGNGSGGVGVGGGGDGSAAASFFKQEVVNNVETETG